MGAFAGNRTPQTRLQRSEDNVEACPGRKNRDERRRGCGLAFHDCDLLYC